MFTSLFAFVPLSSHCFIYYPSVDDRTLDGTMAESSLRRRSVEPDYHSDNIEMKESLNVSEAAADKDGREAYSDDSSDLYNDNAHDSRDMRRLGKKQEFKRNFNFWSALGFVSIYMATWEFVLVSLSVGFANGGFAGLFWCFITTVLCYGTIVASLAEMESMAPTSGGQYHWVSGIVQTMSNA